MGRTRSASRTRAGWSRYRSTRRSSAGRRTRQGPSAAAAPAMGCACTPILCSPLDRQREVERGALVDFALDANGAPVPLDHSLHVCEADAGPLVLLIGHQPLE